MTSRGPFRSPLAWFAVGALIAAVTLVTCSGVRDAVAGRATLAAGYPSSDDVAAVKAVARAWRARS